MQDPIFVQNNCETTILQTLQTQKSKLSSQTLKKYSLILTSCLTMSVTMSRAWTSMVMSAHRTARASFGSSPLTMAASLFRSWRAKYHAQIFSKAMLFWDRSAFWYVQILSIPVEYSFLFTFKITYLIVLGFKFFHACFSVKISLQDFRDISAPHNLWHCKHNLKQNAMISCISTSLANFRTAKEMKQRPVSTTYNTMLGLHLLLLQLKCINSLFSAQLFFLSAYHIIQKLIWSHFTPPSPIAIFCFLHISWPP